MWKRSLLIGLACAAAVGLTLAPAVRVYLSSGWQLAPAGAWVEIGDMAAGGEASPSGRWISFVTVGQGTHEVLIVDARSGAIAGKAPLPGGWIGMAWKSDQSLFVSGGNRGTVFPVTVDSAGRPDVGTPYQIAATTNNGVERGHYLAGLCITQDEKQLVIASSGKDTLYALDLSDGKTLKSLALAEGASPYQLRRSADGMIYASLQGLGEIVEIDPSDLSIKRTMRTGRHPNDMVIVGERLFVSCGNDDVVEVFDLSTGTREERISTRPWETKVAGSTPHALAVTPDGSRLFVANSDNNCAAMLDISVRGMTSMLGLIPTAAYPSALAVTRDGSSLLIGSGKGFGTGPNGFTEKIDPDYPAGHPYIVTLLKGTLAKVQIPEGDAIKKHTQTVLASSAYKLGIEWKPRSAPPRGSSAIPSLLGDPSPIQHVLYIIKENRTYDQLFGDLTKNGRPYGNGEPKLTLFGEDVTPNHRTLAREFVLLDNLFASGEVSVDGHHWTNGAYVPDFMQRTWPQQYSGKGAPRLTPALSQTPTGRIWDMVRRAGKTYRTYYYHTRDRANEEWAAARRRGERDYVACDIFIKEFEEMVKTKTAPNFMVMALSEDHTSGRRAGAFTPKAQVGSNDLALGKVVEAISKSSYWEKFAIFVIEDDAQNGADHVDAHRTVALAISPYTRSKGVDSTRYTTTSFVRSIELILGLPPMSQHDAAAVPLYKSFGIKPDLRPYAALTPKTDLQAKNPPAEQPPILASIDFSEPDQLTLEQEVALNADIWASVKGSTPYPGPTAAQLRARRVKD